MIRNYILWSEMTEEERKFYKKEYDDRIERCEKLGTSYKDIAEDLNEYILFYTDENGETHITVDLTNY